MLEVFNVAVLNRLTVRLWNSWQSVFIPLVGGWVVLGRRERFHICNLHFSSAWMAPFQSAWQAQRMVVERRCGPCGSVHYSSDFLWGLSLHSSLFSRNLCLRTSQWSIRSQLWEKNADYNGVLMRTVACDCSVVSPAVRVHIVIWPWQM